MDNIIPNWIDGKEVGAISGATFEKLNPANGGLLYRVARSDEEDVAEAIRAARCAFENWSEKTPVFRGDILRKASLILQERAGDIAKIVSEETGKSVKDALGEVGAAFEMGMFVAGEGRRFYGHTNTSAADYKMAMTYRQPLGVAGLIIAANTPIANVAWKAFPALLCGNTAIMKVAEDTPYIAVVFAKILKEAGLPDGVFNVIQGYGAEAGEALTNSDAEIISFTGSCAVGRRIQKLAGERLAKVCLELGGKNALIVCDDADLEMAANAVVLSAFSNAGQRCAAGSRIIVFDSVYEDFREMLIAKTKGLRLGTSDEDDLGPVINARQLQNMLAKVEAAVKSGATMLTGGHRLEDKVHKNGYYMMPTIIEGVDMQADISRSELFGPITCLYRARGYEEAVAMANDSDFGLTASIHTKNIDRAMRFIHKMKVGVTVINGPTYGSEPHMPFGGLKDSGNGAREAGMEALDVYSDLKTVYVNYDPAKV